jgi:hypothetical protein
VGIDRHHVRADLGARLDHRGAAQDGEGMDRRVGLQLDVGIDPGRRRVDDGDARDHVLEVDPVAKGSRCGRKLGAGVHASRLDRIGRDVSDHALTSADEVADDVGQVELALRVVRLETIEGRPELVGTEDVDGRVALPQLELFRRRVRGLDDGGDGPIGGTNDPSVGTGRRRLEREHGRGCGFSPMRPDQLLEQPGREQRRVAREDEQAACLADGVACRPHRVARTERALLHGDRRVPEGITALGRGDDDKRRRLERPCCLHHPVDHAPAQNRVQVLRHGGLHARAEPGGHHHGCECRVGH